ncbi:unnamed protein product [Caenorhabditis bovis]|uniref:SprT-like domain-containing protein n=1 Tax=Caenorhabditis bovis TaxID=2654633 RepID=A0A8S1EWA4_9PELO|nr:unnamed protein product [Caenorhabditis bovis]
MFTTPQHKVEGKSTNLLRSLKSENERKILFDLYPELFEKDEAFEKRQIAGGSTNQEKRRRPKIDPKEEFDSDRSNDDDKENTPPLGLSRHVRTQNVSDRSPESSDDDFEEYLKKLRNDSEPAKSKTPPRKAAPTKFVVDDDYISEDEDINFDDDEDESFTSPSDESDRENHDVRRKNEKIAKPPSDDDEHFLISLTESYKGRRHADAEPFVKPGAMRQKKNRENLTKKLFDIFKERCFSEIPDSLLKIEWNSRLRKSAGQCRNHSLGSSTIEMSTVVCTTAERVRDTLVHELCHAAVWIVDKLYKEGHGPGWKKWARQCMREFKSLPMIERCHSYEIEAKFFYVCENSYCEQTIKRQSKSLDMDRKICGRCKGKFILYRFDRRTNQRVLVGGSDPIMEKLSMVYKARKLQD